MRKKFHYFIYIHCISTWKTVICFTFILKNLKRLNLIILIFFYFITKKKQLLTVKKDIKRIAYIGILSIFVIFFWYLLYFFIRYIKNKRSLNIRSFLFDIIISLILNIISPYLEPNRCVLFINLIILLQYIGLFIIDKNNIHSLLFNTSVFFTINNNVYN